MSSCFKCCFGGSKASDDVVTMDPKQSHEEGSPLGLKEKLIKKTCALAFNAHSSSKYYLLEKNKNSSEADLIVSFKGSWAATDWFVSNSKPYGATKINHTLFPSLRSIGNDEAAWVNEAFQLSFQSILRNSSLKHEVNQAMEIGKQIVFTGHSSGAAVAILATFWALEQCLNPNKNQNHKPPLCVTFGSPLVGNHILSHATRRENWSHHFTHFVSRFDIVPRIFLAPLSSIEPMLGSILQFLTPRFKPSTNDSARDSVSSEFYSNVMRNAATVTSYAVSNLMDSTNMLLEIVSGLVDLSPYRPFGTFIFCTGNGQLIVIRNSDAVLQLLFHTALASDLSEVSDIAKKSILQHLNYEAELQDSLKMKNVVHLDQLEGLPLSADGNTATISAALDGLGLNTRARLCLRAAGEWQKRKQVNEEKMKKEINDKALESMKDLKEYKETCEVNMVYYDAFKVQKDARDFQANVRRLVLAGVWDEIIEMLKRHELPDEFEGKQEWIDLGTKYRTLVEPLDIANYYRHSKNKDAGPYMDKGRPRRYRYTQRWLEHAERRRVEEEEEEEEEANYSKSCFWAEVEELCNIANSNKNINSFEGVVKERVVRLEAQIKKWFDKGELDKDVLLEGSTLVKWWKALPTQHKQQSCIRSHIEGKHEPQTNMH